MNVKVSFRDITRCDWRHVLSVANNSALFSNQIFYLYCDWWMLDFDEKIIDFLALI